VETPFYTVYNIKYDRKSGREAAEAVRKDRKRGYLS